MTFIFGMVVGACLGVLLLGIFAAGKSADEEQERLERRVRDIGENWDV